MTTFALIAGMLAVAIIGGTITSTLQTLLEGLLALLLLRWVYRMVKTMGRRVAGRGTSAVAFDQ